MSSAIVAYSGGERLQTAAAALEDADLLHAELAEELHCSLIAEADLLGQVGVGGEREGAASTDAYVGKARRWIQLTDRLAKPGGRDLNRDPARRDCLHRRLIEATEVALRQRPGAAPDLDQVGVGEDVEKAAAGALGERLEVAPPDLVGVPPSLPDVPALVVDRRLTEEVDRADHVVEVTRLEQVGGAVLGSGHEVALDPELEAGATNELAVDIEVVARLFLPERVAPEVERLAEAVDVLGDAQLVDPGRGRCPQVALDVLGGEGPPRRRVGLGGTKVEVVVGQHRTQQIRTGGACRGLGGSEGAQVPARPGRGGAGVILGSYA